MYTEVQDTCRRQCRAFRITEQPPENVIFLEGGRGFGDRSEMHPEGAAEGQAKRQNIITGDFTDLTTSFEIRRPK